jgi:undecaprenyl-diphosphatase
MKQKVNPGLLFLFIVILTGAAFFFDQAIADFIPNLYNAALILIITLLTDIILILTLLAFYSIYSYKSQKKNLGLLWLSILATTILTIVIKFTVQRERPMPVETLIYAFPSLHTAIAFSAAYILSKIRFPALWYELATLIAISRVYLNVHYLSDIIVGAALGLFVAHQVFKKWGAR